MSIMLRSVDDERMLLELRDHYPPVRSIPFSSGMIDLMIAGDLACIETPDRQCAMMREGDRIAIVFSSPESGAHVSCDVAPEELRSAVRSVASPSAYVA